jgi:hypothetical protein
MPSGTLYSVALVITDDSENISLPSSGFFRMIGLHTCVTVESVLINISIEGHYVGSKYTVLWDDFTAVSMKDIFWNFVPCGSN